MPPTDPSANTLVWFKRDLRVLDHAALQAATRSAALLAVFIWEPAVHGFAAGSDPRASADASTDCSPRHRRFIAASVDALAADLAALGSSLVELSGDAVEALAVIHAQWPFGRLVSHQETGNALSFARDRRVAEWCRSHNVAWEEYTQDGVIRRLKSRNGWSKRWDARIRRPLHGFAERLPPLPPDLREALARGLPAFRSAVAVTRLAGLAPAPSRFGQTSTRVGVEPRPGLSVPGTAEQRGGTAAGLAALGAFLQHSGETYRVGMSSPLTGPDVCSRISPHLAHGSLSLSMVVEALNVRRAALQVEPTSPLRSRWLASLKSFEGRLYWHCHFIQKLESAPDIEQHNMVRAFDGMREDDFSRERFERWAAGQTGYPLVDACMRMLATTGWLNFRMRAMLVSFAAFPLWLHWREPGLHLARLFTDYEPGIHWSQMQMQSGTTGINAVRIYNPVKQAHDHDPDGVFVRRWCPELAALPTDWLFEPWKLPAGLQAHFGVQIGRDYPAPVVDFAAATRLARERMAAFRRRGDVRGEAAEVMARHGSRKSGIRQRGERPRGGARSVQTLVAARAEAAPSGPGAEARTIGRATTGTAAAGRRPRAGGPAASTGTPQLGFDFGDETRGEIS